MTPRHRAVVLPLGLLQREQSHHIIASHRIVLNTDTCPVRRRTSHYYSLTCAEILAPGIEVEGHTLVGQTGALHFP